MDDGIGLAGVDTGCEGTLWFSGEFTEGLVVEGGKARTEESEAGVAGDSLSGRGGEEVGGSKMSSQVSSSESLSSPNQPDSPGGGGSIERASSLRTRDFSSCSKVISSVVKYLLMYLGSSFLGIDNGRSIFLTSERLTRKVFEDPNGFTRTPSPCRETTR